MRYYERLLLLLSLLLRFRRLFGDGLRLESLLLLARRLLALLDLDLLPDEELEELLLLLLLMDLLLLLLLSATRRERLLDLDLLYRLLGEGDLRLRGDLDLRLGGTGE